MTKRAVLPCLDAAGSCRFGLTDEQYERIEHLLPGVEGRGCLCDDHRKVTGGIFWTRGSGAPWRDMLKRQGQLVGRPRPLPTLGLWRHP
ncbi:transposase [Salinibacter ruber]|jgi:transposase|uniref:transposase n=1 Tax=Salinibacter ruber TaxID=146919 RepID=UPI001617CE34